MTIQTTHQPLYKSDHYNTLLDSTWSEDGFQEWTDYKEK